MNHKRIQILLLESDPSFAEPLLGILQSKSGLKLFDVKTSTTLKSAFREIQKSDPEILLMDVSPQEDPDFIQFSRLHQYAPQTPLIVLLDNHHQAAALKIVQSGAHDYLLKNQITEETLPTFLIRTLEKYAREKALRESEERFRMMIENASDVITTLEHTGTITYAGPSTERILNYHHSEIIGRNALDYIHRDDRKNFLTHFEKAFEKEGPLPGIQFRFRHRKGHWVPMEAKGRIAYDSSGRRICILNSHDVSHRIKLEDELRSLSMRDELTGLHNRRSFISCFDQQLKLVQRSKKKGIYLLFIDLDGFKWINDNLSHKEGDKALREAAQILKTTFRQADIIARLGGDEFVVFLTDNYEDVYIEGMKKRLNEAVNEWNAEDKRPYKLSMSVGIIYHDPAHPTSVEDLLLKADELMYKQKREKKGILN